MKLFSQRDSRFRAVAGIVITFLIAGMLALGFSTPAFAALPVNFTVDVTTKAGNPLTGVTVYAVPVVDGAEAVGEGTAKATAIKGQAGFYLFSGNQQLVSGRTYTLAFVPTGAITSSTFAQYLGGASDIEHAQTFVVGSSGDDITSLNTSLATNSVISGVVKRSTGSALKGAIVDASFYNGSEWYLESEVITNSKGEYSLTDLEPGSYKLEVYYPGATHAPVFSGGASTMDAATPLRVAMGARATENLRFPSYAGELKGDAEFNNRGNLSKALPAAYPVSVSDSGQKTLDDDRVVFGSRVASNGSWSIKGLGPGQYVVRFFPYYYNEPVDYLAESGSVGNDVNDATVWNVGTGTVNTGWSNVDIGSEGGALEVDVVTNSLTPVGDAAVLLQRTNATGEYYQGTTKADGTVTFGVSAKHDVIRPGSFILSVLGPGSIYEPYQAETYLGSGKKIQQVTLAPLVAMPGFSVAPQIAQLDTTVGTKYVVTSTPARSDAVLSYEWLRGDTPIYGADTSSYTSRTADIGKQLSVRVEASSFGFDDVFASAPVEGIVTPDPDAPALVSPPVLSPSDDSIVHSGSVLSVSPGVWSVNGLDYSYHWTVGGNDIGDTSDTYTVTSTDVDQQISVQVTATDPGNEDATAADTQNTVTPSEGDSPVMITEPAVTETTKGVAKGSERFSVTPGTWTGLDQDFTYQWQRGGANLVTGATYTEVESKANLAEPLTVTVTATAPGFDHTGTAIAAARKATDAMSVSGQPSASIDGSTPLGATDPVPAQGSVTVVDHGVWSAAGSPVGGASLSYTYQWYQAVGTAAAKAIAGATSASYTPPITSIGDKLSFVETAHSPVWAQAVSEKVAAGTVGASNGLVDTAPSIVLPSGTIYPNSTLVDFEAENAWYPGSASVTPQWYGCSPSVCTASSPTSDFTLIGSGSFGITVPQSIAGGWIFLRVSATEPEYVPAQVDSNVGSVDPGTQLQLSSLDIARSFNYDYQSLVNPAVGQSSRLDLATVIDQPSDVVADVDYSYEVDVCSVDCAASDASWQPASGATSFGLSPSYTPSASDYADGTGWARLRETASEDGYAEATAVSTSVRISPGTYDAGTNHPGLLETPVDGSDSETFTVSAPEIGGVTPTVQWYLGSQAIDGLSQVVTTPSVPGIPEYAVVTYSYPGYSNLTFVEVARRLAPPTETTNPDSITGRYRQTLALSDPNPLGLVDYPGVPWQESYDWCLAESGHPNECTLLPTSTFSFAIPTNVGWPVSVNVSYSSPLLPNGTTLTTTVAMTGDLLPALFSDSEGAPVVSWQGTLSPGVAATVTTPNLNPSLSTVDYRWQTSSDGSSWSTVADWSGQFIRTPVTALSYTATASDADRQLRFVVTANSPAYETLVETSDPVTIGHGVAIAEYSAPVITGDPDVGGTLTLDPGTWESDATTHIQWLLDGTAIPGATGTTYTPLAENLGDELSARVTASRSGVADVSDESNRMTISAAAAPAPLTPPKITGKGTASSPLTVSTGSWSLGGLQYTYAWSFGGEVIGGTNTLVLPDGDTVAGTSVTVTAQRSGYADAIITVP